MLRSPSGLECPVRYDRGTCRSDITEDVEDADRTARLAPRIVALVYLKGTLMINEADLHRMTQRFPFKTSTAEGTTDETTWGNVYLTYEVRQVTDVRNLSVASSYLVTCSQRVVIPNPTAFPMTAVLANFFKHYPALLSSSASLPDGEAFNARLVDYSPRTLNATISSTANQSSGTSNSLDRQHTSGSSTSNTNTYGTTASVSGGLEGLTASVSAEHSNSSTNESSLSNMSGSSLGNTRDVGTSDSMSVKDWASYANVDPTGTNPKWTWAQEYPWDVIQYRRSPQAPGPNAESDEVAYPMALDMPEFVQSRMMDFQSGEAFPPSQLSLFGIDFVMKSTWHVTLPDDLAKQVLQVENALAYVSASHEVKPTPADSNDMPFHPYTVYFSLDKAVEVRPASQPLDLTVLGLNAVTAANPVIGFIPSKFLTPPAHGAAFKIIDDTNTLQVVGQGFDDVMTTDFKTGTVVLTLSFKVTDPLAEYTLHMKHWKTSDAGATISIEFNDDGNTIVRHVDTKEGEGGDDNLTSIMLRNLDYAASDYHDFLQLGLNTAVITITPDDAAQPSSYLLKALAIRED